MNNVKTVRAPSPLNHITMTKIYTKTGDAGKTALVGVKRVEKTCAQLEAYGTVDELNSVIGTAIEELRATEVPAERAAQRDDLVKQMCDIQNRLFTVGGILATESENRDKYWKESPLQAWTTVLETKMDEYTEFLPKVHNFVLPRGSKCAAQLHVARTVARRTERNICRMGEEISQDDEFFNNVKKYANRLSDFFFIAARFVLYIEKKDENYWESDK